MKILQVHNYYRYRGGEDRYAETIGQALTASGHQVVPFHYDSKDISSFGPWQKLSIPTRVIRSGDVNRRLRRLLKEQPVDLAMVHNLFPLISLSTLEILKEHNIPVVKRLENYRFLCLNGLFLRTGHGVCDVCKTGNFFPGIRHGCYQESRFNSLGMALPLMLSNWRRLLSETVDCFLAPSGFVKDIFTAAGFPAEKIEVLPNFLDFQPLEAPAQAGDYAVFVGRFSQEKGLLTLLKAMEQLPDLPLKILGDGPMMEELKEFARSRGLKRIEFPGFVDGPAKIETLSRARFLVFPSECYESFGYSIIEAFACGTPAVAAAMGGSEELVTDGENGYLFEAGKVEQLREKMSRMAGLDSAALAQMKKNALGTAKATYTREAGYQSLMALLKKVEKDFAKRFQLKK